MDRQKINRNFKILRKKSGLTQQEVANYLDIERANISYYETGQRDIPLKHLEKLSDLFGVKLDVFFQDDKSQLQTDLAFAFRDNNKDPQTLEVLADFKKIVKNYIRMKKLEKRYDKKL